MQEALIIRLLVNVGSRRLQEAAHSTQPSSTPTDLPCSYQRADDHFQSTVFSTSPARTGFKCMSCSFSSSFTSL